MRIRNAIESNRFPLLAALLCQALATMRVFADKVYLNLTNSDSALLDQIYAERGTIAAAYWILAAAFLAGFLLRRDGRGKKILGLFLFVGGIVTLQAWILLFLTPLLYRSQPAGRWTELGPRERRRFLQNVSIVLCGIVSVFLMRLALAAVAQPRSFLLAVPAAAVAALAAISIFLFFPEILASIAPRLEAGRERLANFALLCLLAYFFAAMHRYAMQWYPSYTRFYDIGLFLKLVAGAICALALLALTPVTLEAWFRRRLHRLRERLRGPAFPGRFTALGCLLAALCAFLWGSEKVYALNALNHLLIFTLPLLRAPLEEL